MWSKMAIYQTDEDRVRNKSRLEIFRKVLRVKPANPLKRCPELACFVDVNLASLLRVGFAELFADAQLLEAGHEDATLAA